MSGRASALDDVPGLRPLARRQLGVVRRDQLAVIGVTHHHVRTQIDSKRWQRLGPRIVLLHTGPLTREQRFIAAVLHGGEASGLAGRTALERAGLRGWERPPIHLALPREARIPPLVGVVTHLVASLPRHHLVGEVPRWCTPVRAAVDAASWERDDRSASGLIIAVVQQRLATAPEMAEALGELGRVRRAPVIRAALERAATGSESLAEADIERVVRSLGLGPIRRQVWVQTRSGRRRLDLVVLLPDGRSLVIEVDGVHHLDPRQRLDDAARDAELLSLGYVPLHVPSWADRAWLRRQLQAFVAP